MPKGVQARAKTTNLNATVQQKTYKENQNLLKMRNYGNATDTINNDTLD